MRQASAALFALVGFLAAALLTWHAGAEVPMILGRGLAAMAGFGLLGYALGAAGERILREVTEKETDKAVVKPEARKPPVAGGAGPSAPAPAGQAPQQTPRDAAGQAEAPAATAAPPPESARKS